MARSRKHRRSTRKGFQKATLWLDPVTSKFKSHVLITDGAPFAATGPCKNGESLGHLIGGTPEHNYETFTDIRDTPCRAECAVLDCDATGPTGCLEQMRPWAKADCLSEDGKSDKGKAEACECALHVAELFNAVPHFSTTVVGVQNAHNPEERYTEIFDAMASTPGHYIDAMGGELGEDDITEYVDRTLRAACNTPYQKCQRNNDVSTFPRDKYADGDDEFQHKSWAIGCDFAEKYPDLPEGCDAECDGGDGGGEGVGGCCGETCSGNCDTSRLICRDACDYDYDLADG
ncbi:hypothetical protein JL722_1469 [Aureococcus anophagefferens]|nr:hypothetical protein JL722_1469 [Aureococcus anophagefferens]